MNPIHVSVTIETDGEIRLSNLPLKRGEQVEMILIAAPAHPTQRAIRLGGALAPLPEADAQTDPIADALADLRRERAARLDARD
ncbi:MAG TPA: hypothetical protein VF897_19280, partial [Roseiflexaceae bacterium]